MREADHQEEQSVPTVIRPPTLAKAMEDFDPEPGQAEILRFRQMSLREAIKKAAESRKENGHPYEHQQKNWNFWPDAIRVAIRILSAEEARFRECQNFDGIHCLVKELLEDARPSTDGLGVLYFYDVASRISACLGDKYLPKKVYLHAGTLEGAMQVLPGRRLVTLQPFEQCPKGAVGGSHLSAKEDDAELDNGRLRLSWLPLRPHSAS